MGTFYSQRDSKWSAKNLGSTRQTVGRFGCTITSIAMALSYFGKKLTPADLAKRLSFTVEGFLIWGSLPAVTGFKLINRFKKRNDSTIKEALKNPRRFVILNVDKGAHWVLALTPSGAGYSIGDPWDGAKANSSRYPDITGGAVLEQL